MAETILTLVYYTVLTPLATKKEFFLSVVDVKDPN
jgi:hypothetical protein